MDRDKFRSLTDNERIEWFNEQYVKGKKHSEIIKEYGLAKNTVADTFKRHSYKFDKDLGRFVHIEGITCENITEHVEITENQHVSNIEVVEDVVVSDDIISPSNTLVMDDSLQSDLIKMISWYKTFKQEQDELKEVIHWYRSQKDSKNIIEVAKLEINKDVIKGEVKTRSFTIHSNVLEMFNEFASKSPYSKQDLLGQALLEFVRRYE